jgi:flagellar biosynthesis protein FlhB
VIRAQKLSPVLKPLFRIFKVSNLEELIKRLLKLVFTFVLLIPLVLLPLYFFFFTLLHA